MRGTRDAEIGGRSSFVDSLLLRALTVASVACLVACSAAGPGGGPGGASSSGSSVPDFTVNEVDGDEFHMAEHVGSSVILLNFWATWCEPCRVEMPHLDRLQNELGDEGLQIVAVSMDGPESVSQVRSYIGRYDYSFTVVLDQESEVTRLYNPRRAAPYSVLVDRSGAIVWSHEGYNPGDEVELETRLRDALSSAPGSATSEAATE